MRCPRPGPRERKLPRSVNRNYCASEGLCKRARASRKLGSISYMLEGPTGCTSGLRLSGGLVSRRVIRDLIRDYAEPPRTKARCGSHCSLDKTEKSKCGGKPANNGTTRMAGGGKICINLNMITLFDGRPKLRVGAVADIGAAVHQRYVMLSG